jgi:hypothetical protein
MTSEIARCDALALGVSAAALAAAGAAIEKGATETVNFTVPDLKIPGPNK